MKVENNTIIVVSSVGIVEKVEKVLSVDFYAGERLARDGGGTIDEAPVGGCGGKGAAKELLPMEVGQTVALMAFNLLNERKGGGRWVNVVSW